MKSFKEIVQNLTESHNEGLIKSLEGAAHHLKTADNSQHGSKDFHVHMALHHEHMHHVMEEYGQRKQAVAHMSSAHSHRMAIAKAHGEITWSKI